MTEKLRQEILAGYYQDGILQPPHATVPDNDEGCEFLNLFAKHLANYDPFDKCANKTYSPNQRKQEVLRVPHSSEGERLVTLYRKFVNKGYKVRLRGRGARAKVALKLGNLAGDVRNELPLKHAEAWALYIHRDYKATPMTDEEKKARGLVYVPPPE